jgi:cation diffusion facilitator family transporter
MESPPKVGQVSEADREKHSVARSSLLAAILLTGTKLGVGLWTNSLGILSEAAHSGLDLAAAAMTLWAVRVSGRPADVEHAYGHGKVENLSALGETLLLLVTCVWIIYESIRRLFFEPDLHVEANIWAFLVVVISIAVDYSRSRALSRAAKKHDSLALEADALHFSTDIWSSAVVLVGLIGVVAGQAIGRPWLAQADSVAALGVAAIVIAVCYNLGKRTINDLLDISPGHVRDRVAAAAAGVPGVVGVSQVRVRRSGPGVFADVTLSVDHAASFQKTHDIADEAEKAIRAVVPKVDVVVHVEPVAGPDEDVLTTVRVLAGRHGLAAHGVRVYEEQGRRFVELHLEVHDSLTLEEAHRQADDFEQDLRQAVPGLARIITHLEPSGGESAILQAETAGRREVDQAIREFLHTSDLALVPHDVKVQRTGDELAVSFHCTLDAGTSITAAHELTERLETHLRAKVPAVGRVVIHVEPSSGGMGDRVPPGTPNSEVP